MSRRALNGWYFYLLPVAIIVGILGWDAYLNIETRRNDYEVATLKREAAALNDALDKLRNTTASAHQLRRLEDKATELGLAEVAPWQIERVNLGAPLLDASSFDIASAVPRHVPSPQAPRRTMQIAVAPAAPAPPAALAALPPVAPQEVDIDALLEANLLDTMPAHVALMEQAPNNPEVPMMHETEQARPVAPAPEVVEAAPTEILSLDDSVEFMLEAL